MPPGVGPAPGWKLRRPKLTRAQSQRTTAAICTPITQGEGEKSAPMRYRPAKPASIAASAIRAALFSTGRSSLLRPAAALAHEQPAGRHAQLELGRPGHG